MSTQESVRSGGNVQLVEDAFDAINAGDPSKFVDLLDDDFTVCAWALHGGGQRLLNKQDYLAAFGIVEKLDDVKTEIVESRPVGEDIVDCTVRAYRTYGDHTLDTNMIMCFRFRGDKVLRMVEVCDEKFEKFWDDTGIEE